MFFSEYIVLATEQSHPLWDIVSTISTSELIEFRRIFGGGAYPATTKVIPWATNL